MFSLIIITALVKIADWVLKVIWKIIKFIIVVMLCLALIGLLTNSGNRRGMQYEPEEQVDFLD